MSVLCNLLLAWIPFVHPVKLPAGARLWMVLPLVLCVAMVYRATRVRHVHEMPKATLLTFVYIVIGMVAIAIAFYLVHHAVLYFS
ncbi:MAG: hypothetical protein ABIG44_16220 [Planctomycetota bacterium]